MTDQSVQSEESSATLPSHLDAQDCAGECRYSLPQYGVVFCAALLTRMVHILALKASPIFQYKIGDAARYDQWAKTLAAGSWMGEGVFYQAPLYPYFLGVIYKFIGDDILTVRRVQALFGAISCVLIMKAAGNLFGKRSGMLAGLILAFYAPSIFLESLIQKSILDLFFLSLLLFLFTQSLRSRNPSYWLGVGIATGALCLTRENALVLIPILGCWIVLGNSKRIGLQSRTFTQILPVNRFVWMAAMGMGLCLTLGPVVLRNYTIGGHLHLTTSQLGPNFFIGNNANANGTYQPLVPGRGDAKYEQQDAIRLAEAEAGHSLSPKQVSQHFLSKSVSYIKSEPLSWLGLIGMKAAMTFNAMEIIDTEDQYTVADWSPVLRVTNVVFHFGTLVPLAILGLVVTRRKWQSLWLLYLISGAFALTVVAFFVFGRYRYPLVPVFIIFAAPAILFLEEEIRTRNWKSIVSSSVAIAFLFAICNFEITSPNVGRGITLSNYGVQALIRNDFSHAEEFLNEAKELLPKSHLVHNNLGVLYRETQRKDLAILHFRIATELEPRDTKVRMNLKRILAVKTLE